MELVNSHSHTTNSDGQLSVLELAREAVKHGLKHLYITDHHIPRKNIFPFRLNFPDYLLEIENAAEQVSRDIRLYKGVELDWVFGHENWFERQTKNPLDFVLGSVHTITPNHFYAAELPPENRRALIREYFNQIRRLASTGLADCIAHLDLIKLSGGVNEEDYKDEVERTLEVIARSKTAIEINTSGKRKGSLEYNPSNWVLQLAFQKSIPITIGTDSHRPQHLTYDLEEAYELAKRIGYKTIFRFEDRKPIEMPLESKKQCATTP